MITTADALQSLKPKAQWVLRGDELEWLDTEQTEPTDIEIQTEIGKLKYLEGIQQYQQDRVYPPMGEQLDNIFHNGVDAWKVDIQAVKDAHPKVLPVEADQQTYIDEHVATYTFNKQLREYTAAIARLDNYILADSRVEPTVEQTVYDEEGEATTSTIENPLITTDNAERVAAQAVVDNTPQPVIDKAEE